MAPVEQYETTHPVIGDDEQAAQSQPVEEPDTPQEEPKPKAPTKYTVLTADRSLNSGFRVVGEYEVVGGQQAARKAAVADDSDLKAEVLAGEEPFVAAVANWNPVPAKVKAPDEPRIEV